MPPFATGSKPVTPVVKGSPVALVRTPDAGVPKAGLVKVGAVSVSPAIVVVVLLPAIGVEPRVIGNPPPQVVVRQMVPFAAGRM